MLIPRLSFGKLVHISSSLMTLLLAMNVHALAEHFHGNSLYGMASVTEGASGSEASTLAKSGPTPKEKEIDVLEGWLPLSSKHETEGAEDDTQNNAQPKAAGKEKKNDCENGISCVGVQSGTAAVGTMDLETQKAETSLVKDILARQVSLSTQEKELKEQKRVLDAAKVALDEKMRNLNAMLTLLAEKQAAHQETMSAETDRLVKIYEDMPPKEAAAVFNIMDIHVLVPVVSKMIPRKVSAILGVMLPERVNLISQYLAGIRTFHSPHGFDGIGHTDQATTGNSNVSWWLKPQVIQQQYGAQQTQPLLSSSQ
ncbi:MAG: hypothetical protein IJ934_00020 [Acetobacter sp.]|nr:hypothetical protein [Acetobacter sp.]